MDIFFSIFTVTDWLQLIGILSSLITSIVAISISIKTLKQNNKMIEESSRPMIHIYSKYVDGMFYIIIKNFGKSVAHITNMKTDFNISENNKNTIVGNPFIDLIGASIPPNCSKTCPLVAHTLKIKKFNFNIEYHSDTHKYNENIILDMDSENPFPDTYPSIDNKDDSELIKALKIISHTLQDILRTKL